MCFVLCALTARDACVTVINRIARAARKKIQCCGINTGCCCRPARRLAQNIVSNVKIAVSRLSRGRALISELYEYAGAY